MQPWRIGAGLIVTFAGSAVLVCGTRFKHLVPIRRVILADNDQAITLHLGLVHGDIVVSLYGIVCATGLADLGRLVDLVERSVRRCEGDSKLAEALWRDADCDWD